MRLRLRRGVLLVLCPLSLGVSAEGLDMAPCAGSPVLLGATHLEARRKCDYGCILLRHIFCAVEAGNRHETNGLCAKTRVWRHIGVVGLASVVGAIAVVITSWSGIRVPPGSTHSLCHGVCRSGRSYVHIGRIRRGVC